MTIRSKLVDILSCSTLVLCFGGSNTVQAAQHRSPKTPKTFLPPIWAGPTGPIPQIPLDSIPTLPPQVTYQNRNLTIIAPNSTLSDILIAVRKQTGAEIAIPVAPDRVVTRLGPGPPADVLSKLLTGSRFNFVLLSSSTDTSTLRRVVLLAKSVGDNAAKPSLATPNTPSSQAETTSQPVQDQPEEPQGMLETPDEL